MDTAARASPNKENKETRLNAFYPTFSSSSHLGLFAVSKMKNGRPYRGGGLKFITATNVQRSYIFITRIEMSQATIHKLHRKKKAKRCTVLFRD